MRLADRLQFDEPLFYAMAARIWQTASGPITIIMLLNALSPTEQGIYYSLVSILSIQMFFELGLLNILVSYAGHQAAVNHTETGRRQTGELIRSSMRWFSGASALFGLSALAAGWWIMSDVDPLFEWQTPLVAVVVASAVTVAVSPALAILEGFGFRKDVYRVRLVHVVTGSIAVWITLSLGFKLWALVAAACVQAVCTVYLPLIKFAGFFRQFRISARTGREFSWMRDVIPIQWRLALISAIHHLATQFFTVIVFEFHSEVAAGRLGMTLSVTTAIQALAAVWVQTKFAVISMHHGAGNREAAGMLWRRTAIISTSLLVLALSAAAVMLWLLPLAKLGLENRFITPAQFLVLAIGHVANHVVSLESFYVTARRARPLLVAAVIGSSCTLLAVWIGGYLWSTDGVLLGYALGTALLTLPLHTLAYLKFRQEHASPAGAVSITSADRSDPHR